MSRGVRWSRSDALGGFSMLTSHSEVRAAAGDPETFSSADGITLPKQPFRLAPIEYDPPEHTFCRPIFKPVMTVKVVRAVEHTVRRDAGARSRSGAVRPGAATRAMTI